MPSLSATRRASSASAAVQQPCLWWSAERRARGAEAGRGPTSPRPPAVSRWAATLESTPPLMANTVRAIDTATSSRPSLTRHEPALACCQHIAFIVECRGTTRNRDSYYLLWPSIELASFMEASQWEKDSILCPAPSNQEGFSANARSK